MSDFNANLIPNQNLTPENYRCLMYRFLQITAIKYLQYLRGFKVIFGPRYKKKLICFFVFLKNPRR